MEINGHETVNSIILSDNSTLEVDGIFVFIGLKPSTEFLGGLLKMERGFIVTDKTMMTTEQGLFAIGDCRFGAFRQVVTACGEGAIAAEEARKYIETKKGIQYDW